MASVTEDSLNLAAHQIVADLVDDGLQLNDGVRKKASELGLNRDQTARLIERTNSEAFLRMFPETTDFTVADPSVIFADSEKMAGDSCSHTDVKGYAARLERDPYDIFGVANEKTASYEDNRMASDVRTKLIDMVYTRHFNEAARVEKTAKLLEIEQAENNLWQVFKTAAYSGTPVSAMESELLLAFPNQPLMVTEMVGALTEKLASVALLHPEIMKRASLEGFEPNKVVKDSVITRAFQEVIDVVR